MTKIHFRPYNPNQTVLFPPRIDEDIAEHDPVRMVDALVESLILESFRKLYKECGRSPYPVSYTHLPVVGGEWNESKKGLLQ